jgi:hypothetical protein
VLGWYGLEPDAGFPTAKTVPAETLAARATAGSASAAAIGARTDKQVLFGDLHVHSTFSTDAFLFSLPITGGEGVHPVGDACDFARFCSSLDFWSINDHAEALTTRKWEQTKETIRRCNAVSGEGAPDVIAFLGWEWTQVGTTADAHWGHKNVVLRDLEDDRVPARPVNAGGFTGRVLGDVPLSMRLGPVLLDPVHRQRYYDLDAFAREIADAPVCEKGIDSRKLPRDCMESAETPAELFEKLSQWGHESLVIPHGTTWGFYTPAAASWDHQLTSAQHDPDRQTLIEVYSGHGNSEEFRSFEPVRTTPDGALECPPPTPDYLPSCWRAGELIRERCLAEGEDEVVCEERAAQARAYHVAAGVAGRLVVPGARADEWLDAGQCRDCFLPAFNYRPKSSVQYIAALTNFAEPAGPRRFRFGFIASSDVHSARPGTGYKEFAREEMTEQGGPPRKEWEEAVRGEPVERSAEPVPVDVNQLPRNPMVASEFERQNSFWLTGGLVAVHAAERTRDGVWGALRRKETYGTSGDRILLWFDLVNAPGEQGSLPMGSEVAMRWAPRFEVRAIGAFEQKPGCPDYSVNALSPERLAYLCRGECYHPSDVRKPIARIEIVRIRPQAVAGEPLAPLIEDPWKRFDCAPDPNGCTVTFDDPDFAVGARDVVYYARAIEPPSPAVNAGGLRCVERDAQGRCLRLNPCWGDYRTPADDDCLAPAEERAWSSPIYVDWSAKGGEEGALAEPGALEER